MFVASTSIRYCYYKETHKILGNTFGMVVLQDFEALTPNLLARTIETVEGRDKYFLSYCKFYHGIVFHFHIILESFYYI